MKIILPNPDECQSIDDFFEQLELCVYHAQKSWEKIKKKYSEEELIGDNKPTLSFRVPFIWDNYDDYFKIPDERHDQEIEIEINEQ